MDIQREIKSKPLWRKYWYVMPILCLLIAAYSLRNVLGNASYIVQKNELVTAKVEQGNFTVNVRATGVLKPLNRLGLKQRANIVVVADHGMVNLSEQRVINLDPWIDLSAFIIPDWSDENNSVHAPFLNLYATPEIVDAAYQKLNQANPKMRVLRRGDFPANYHFDHPQREPDLMLLADTGWSIYASRDKSPPQPMLKLSRSIATHGYDNQDPLMHATFIASGPKFKLLRLNFSYMASN